MNSDDETMRSAFSYITGETEHVCRLCFASTIEKEVAITENVTMEPLLPEVLCVNCAAAVKKSFLFKKLYQHSHNKWNELMSRLSKSLDLADTAGPKVVLAFLVVSESENIMFTSRKSQEHMNKKAALAKIKNIIKSRQNYTKLKKKPKSCDICKGKFNSNCHLEKHYKKMHNKTMHPCCHCTKVFSSLLQLEGHTERVHLSKKIQCSKCPKMFSTERLLRYHDKFHHIATVCKLCFVQFPSKKDLRAHMDKHDVNKCPKCDKSILNRHTFKMHLTICGVTEKPPRFFCDICEKGYVQKNGLKTHLKISHGFGQTLSCKWCGKKYDAISRLKNHIVKHTKERNFYCDICNGKFVSKAALMYHFRLHTGERPFRCDLCNESFLSASRRMEHKRRKHFEPTKLCPICPMKFVTKNQLGKHLDRHSNPHSKLYVAQDSLIYSGDPL